MYNYGIIYKLSTQGVKSKNKNFNLKCLNVPNVFSIFATNPSLTSEFCFSVHITPCTNKI